MNRFRLSQREIVFAAFAALFILSSIFLHGFLTFGNILTLLQTAAVLGLLGLAMAIVVIGGGVDISLIAALAAPPGLVLQMVENGHSVTSSLLPAVLVSIAFGLANGWLIAYAEAPSVFATLASGILLAGLGQAAMSQLDVVSWSAGLGGFERPGQGSALGIPSPIVMFVVAGAGLLRGTHRGAYVYAIGGSPDTVRPTGIPARPITVLQYGLAALIGCLAGLVLASVNSLPTHAFPSTLIYDVVLVAVLGGVGLSGGRSGVLNVIIGTLLIGTLLNAMTIMNVSCSGQNLVKGVVLLLAVIADSILNPRIGEAARQGDG